MIDINSVWLVLLSVGIPSAIVGFLVRKLEKKIDKQEQARTEREEARQKHEKMMVDMSMASLSLAEATAEAVQRIPDANCNGEMHSALAEAKAVIKEYRNFEREQVIKAVS